MSMLTTLDNCISLEEVVSLVNTGGLCGLKPEDVAADYAYASSEIKDEDNYSFHLDYLNSHGAKFDYSKALKICMYK